MLLRHSLPCTFFGALVCSCSSPREAYRTSQVNNSQGKELERQEGESNVLSPRRPYLGGHLPRQYGWMPIEMRFSYTAHTRTPSKSFASKGVVAVGSRILLGPWPRTNIEGPRAILISPSTCAYIHAYVLPYRTLHQTGLIQFPTLMGGGGERGPHRLSSVSRSAHGRASATPPNHIHAPQWTTCMYMLP